MIVYFDENMPRHLAEGFHILQMPDGFKTGNKVEVKFIPTEFGYGAKDVDWIPEVGKQKACVLTQDTKINRRKHEYELYQKHKVGIFFLKKISKKQGLSIWQMTEALAKNWEEISRIACTEKKPFGYEFTIKGKIAKVG